MTLRTRLVAALVALTTVGLVAFGLVTYRTYARSQYDRLDERLAAAAPLVERMLDWAGAFGDGAGPGAGGPFEELGDAGPFGDLGDFGHLGDGDGPPIPAGPVVLPPGTYAERRAADGTVTPLTLGQQDAAPDLPDDVSGRDGPFTVGSTEGDTRWRALVTEEAHGTTSVVATPTTEVEAALDRLVLIELAAGGVLLVVLALGSWLILRRGLSPLERMAVTARSVTAGNLAQRVSPAGEGNEVGQLGLALNTMLDDLEKAFAERDATEQRLRQFLADASHELRTPLTSIHGFAELFRLSRPDLALPPTAADGAGGDGRGEAGGGDGGGGAAGEAGGGASAASGGPDAPGHLSRGGGAGAPGGAAGTSGPAGTSEPAGTSRPGSAGGAGGRIELPVILRRIEEETERMQALVEDLLLLARLDRTREPASDPVDLAVLAADACTDAVAVDRARKVTLSADGPVVVRGDRDHLRQAIGNLVGNAIQHTPAGTPVDVAVRADGGRAVVEVRDHGPGLDDEAARHVFDRFWRADSARVGRGAGLGLSIVAAIAEEHGGTASATNAPDGGAVFALHLPADTPT